LILSQLRESQPEGISNDGVELWNRGNQVTLIFGSLKNWLDYLVLYTFFLNETGVSSSVISRPSILAERFLAASSVLL
jgi:hypothetical protein